MELALLRDEVGELRIEGVDALDEQDGLRIKPEFAAVVFAYAGDEIVFRHLDLLAVQQTQHVFLQGIVVHGVEIVEVVAAVREERSVHAVHEIVVGGEGHRAQSAGHQLDAEPLGDSGLAGAARTGDEHQAHLALAVVEPVYLLGDLHDLLLLQGLGHLDELTGPALAAGDVQLAHVAQAHNLVPAEGLKEHVEGLGLLEERSHLPGIVAVGNAEDETVVIGHQGPGLQVPGARDQRVIVHVRSAVEGVVAHIDVTARFQQAHLVLLAQGAEKVYRLPHLHLVAVERQVQIHQRLHPGLYLPYDPGVHDGPARQAQVAVVALGNGPAKIELATRPEVAASLREKEAERAAIGAAAAVRTIVQEFDVAVVEDAELQSLEHVVHLGGENDARAFELE